ncbi:hypothetical protein C8Q75DRAFT_145590 [Abortiporus biennis]|nr:hypothetical protein C8Q75DRAFT_145590 [Abortiporus biennis]
MPSIYLPPELKNQIVGELQAARDMCALKSLTLVAKEWSFLAKCQLFQRLVFEWTVEEHVNSNLVDFLQSTREIPNLIHELHLIGIPSPPTTIDQQYNSQPRFPEIPDLNSYLLSKILSKLPNLTSLHIRTIYWRRVCESVLFSDPDTWKLPEIPPHRLSKLGKLDIRDIRWSNNSDEGAVAAELFQLFPVIDILSCDGSIPSYGYRSFKFDERTLEEEISKCCKMGLRIRQLIITPWSKPAGSFTSWPEPLGSWFMSIFRHSQAARFIEVLDIPYTASEHFRFLEDFLTLRPTKLMHISFNLLLRCHSTFIDTLESSTMCLKVCSSLKTLAFQIGRCFDPEVAPFQMHTADPYEYPYNYLTLTRKVDAAFIILSRTTSSNAIRNVNFSLYVTSDDILDLRHVGWTLLRDFINSSSHLKSVTFRCLKELKEVGVPHVDVPRTDVLADKQDISLLKSIVDEMIFDSNARKIIHVLGI